MLPRKGSRITADWARSLQVRDSMPIPPGGARTPVGVIAPSNVAGNVGIIAQNGASALNPWTLVGLTTLTPAVTDDGVLRLEVRTGRSKLLATTGPTTVPANGLFIPFFFDMIPTRVKAVSTDYWAEGIPCGREPNGTLLTSREGGLICVKIPDANNYAWVISDFNAVWDGVTVGPVDASSDPIAGGITGVAAIIKDDAVIDQRVDLCSRSDVTIPDGTVVTIGYTDRWSLLWANCSPTAAAEGLDPTPEIGIGGP